MVIKAKRATFVKNLDLISFAFHGHKTFNTSTNRL